MSFQSSPPAMDPESQIVDLLGTAQEGRPIDFTALREAFREMERREGLTAPAPAPAAPAAPEGLLSPEELARKAAAGPPGVPLGTARVPASEAVPGTPPVAAAVPPAMVEAAIAAVVQPQAAIEEVAGTHVERLNRRPTVDDLALALDQAGLMFASLYDKKRLLELDVRMGITLTPEGWQIGTAHFPTGTAAGQTTITGHIVEHDALGSGMLRVLQNTLRTLDGGSRRRR